MSKSSRRLEIKLWTCVFCNEICDKSCKILVNHVIKKILDNFNESKRLVTHLESDLEKYEILKNETSNLSNNILKIIKKKPINQK